MTTEEALKEFSPQIPFAYQLAPQHVDPLEVPPIIIGTGGGVLLPRPYAVLFAQREGLNLECTITDGEQLWKLKTTIQCEIEEQPYEEMGPKTAERLAEAQELLRAETPVHH